MEQIGQFLKANSFFVIILLCFIFVVILFYSQKKTLKVTAKAKGYAYFKKRECAEFKKSDEAALNNITITISTKKLDAQSDVSNLYEKTASIGCKLLAKENFSFSNVGQV